MKSDQPRRRSNQTQPYSTDVPSSSQLPIRPKRATAGDKLRNPATTSRIMSRVRSRDSVAELAIRRRLWAMGLRFWVRTTLAGRPDIVFPREKLAIFIDGDFWHGNAWRVRGLPSFEAQFINRSQWWIDKIRRNMARDTWVTRELERLGWRVERVWESDVLAAPEAVAIRLARIIRPEAVADHRSPSTSLERRRYHSIALKEHREAYGFDEGPQDDVR